MKLRKQLSKFYHFIKKQYYTNLGFDKDFILVYTLSKVGSSSVYYSLKKTYPFKEIHHVHFLGDTWLDKFKTGHRIFNNNLKNAERIFTLLNKKPWRVKIIALTRDPIARDISGMFQTWQHVFDVPDITEVPAEQIVAQLHKNDFLYSQNWFETDFLEFTGLDVFQAGFDAEQGYQIYKTDQADILIMQLEQLNAIYSEAMQAFLGKGSYVLQKENITSSRESGALHSQVKKRLRLSPESLQEICSSAYMTTFYNAAQIDTIKKRWEEK
ncbi:putative capsular polysaccharide synthesis family protein [Xanthomarina gelatinilytica]|uniref:putative capsular polysaccharide synthesis family protein n=1 Tax=Xanthomarina gelatinilytica TaxID=1137281 RepID=UPI003AA998EB